MRRRGSAEPPVGRRAWWLGGSTSGGVGTGAGMVDDGRDTVLLPAIPEVFALYLSADDPPSPGEVLGWVVVLPDGRVLMVRGRPTSREIVWCESLDHVERFWSPVCGGDVVRVTASALTATA